MLAMTWRVGVAIVGLSVVASGCARPEMGYRNTAPIRTEPPRTTGPISTPTTNVGVASIDASVGPVESVAPTLPTVVVVDAPPAPAVLLNVDVPTSTRPAPGTSGFVPAPIPADYKYSVIVKVVARTPLEQEVIDASLDLFPKFHLIVLRSDSDRTVLGTVLRGALIGKYRNLLSNGERFRTEPGKGDRTVIQSLRKVSKNSAIVRACEYDGATTYELNTTGQWANPDAGTATLIWERQLARGPQGWRIVKITILGLSKGVDKCVAA
jgi:hypothetical protein